MATKLGVAPNYYTSFVDGQGVGAANYFVYASHFDVNFVAIKTSLNAVIDEVQAVNGTSALIAYDLTQLSDPVPTIGVVSQGVLGGHSYVVTRNSDTELEVSRGQAILNNTRVTSDSVVTFSAIINDGTKYIALDAGGIPFIEIASGQRTLDVMKVTMTGGVLIASSMEQLAHVMPDGDQYNDAASRDDESAVWATGGAGSPLDQGVLRAGYKVFRGLAARFRAIERMLIGYSTEDDGDALPVHGLAPGAVGAPSLVMTDGAGSRDSTTGFYRLAPNVWVFSASGAFTFSLAAQGLGAIDGLPGTPSFYFNSDGNTGMYRVSGDVGALAAGGEKAIQFGDIAGGGVGLPNKLRARAHNFTGAQVITDATWEAIDLDVTEDFDIGSWHDLVTNSSRMTCPANGDGLYHVEAHANFDAQNLNGYIGIRLALNGVALSPTEQVQAVSRVGDNGMQTGAYLDLVEDDYVEVFGYDGSSGTIGVEAVLTIVRAA